MRKSTPLGLVVKKRERPASHKKKVSSLIAELIRISAESSIQPKIQEKSQLQDYDTISIEGERCWNDRMNKYVVENCDGAVIEYNPGGVTILIPVRESGTLVNSIWLDLFASLSLFVLCSYLLYYYLTK